MEEKDLYEKQIGWEGTRRLIVHAQFQEPFLSSHYSLNEEQMIHYKRQFEEDMLISFLPLLKEFIQTTETQDSSGNTIIKKSLIVKAPKK